MPILLHSGNISGPKKQPSSGLSMSLGDAIDGRLRKVDFFFRWKRRAEEPSCHGGARCRVWCAEGVTGRIDWLGKEPWKFSLTGGACPLIRIAGELMT